MTMFESCLIIVFPRGKGNKFLGDATHATGIELYPGVGTCRSGRSNVTVAPIKLHKSRQKKGKSYLARMHFNLAWMAR